jgi:RNA polymerase sigma factor (sigma-70 family)
MGHFGRLPHLPSVTDLAIHDATASDPTVRLAAAGDQTAFARLVAAHHPSMARVAYAITGDSDLAADAVQVAWSTAWRRLGSLRDHETVRIWLVAIAANEARQALRRQRRKPVVNISTTLEAGVGGDPADRIATVDLARALRALKPDDRALLALRFAAGLDSTQIATQLGISASGVRSRLARLIERLRTELDHA